MSNTIVFFGVLGIIAAALLLMFISYFIYKDSVMFKALTILIVPLDSCALLGFLIGALGLIHLSWAVPVAFVIILISINFLKKMLINPITEINTVSESLYHGDVNVSINPEYKKGKHEIAASIQMLDKLTGSLKNIVTFADSIGKGDLSADYQLTSDRDILGLSMQNMRNNLQKAEDEKLERKIEDERRNWVTDGLAKFAELLRSNNDSMTDLSQSIVSNLVKYVNANQAGIYILNDDDENHKYLELTACYAYERKKYNEKKIEIGEGLVGACFLEKQSIYMTNLPQNYIHITSGLGDDTPKALFIVPLIINEVIYGIIEIASFGNFETYVREFIEKVGESIAATISSVKTNTRTNKLLEISKMQAEEMANQEEELRQNMEEMQATQEEMRRRETELSEAFENMKMIQKESLSQEKNMQQLFNSLKKSFTVIEFSPDGYISDINQLALDMMGRKKEDIVNQPMSVFISDSEKVLARVRSGETFLTTQEIKNGDQTFKDKVLFVPFFNSEENIERIIVISYTIN